MKRIYNYLMTGLLLLMGSNLSLHAQGDFNPDNPEDPQMNYKVKTSVEPQSAGAWIDVWDENGDGRYRYGEQITLRCPDPNGAYTFTHWTLNGEHYSTNTEITYKMKNASVSFVAHYMFLPGNPNDPSYISKNRLYLVAEPLTACTFWPTVSGEKWSYDEWKHLDAYTNNGYKFIGWYYPNSTLCSKSLSFHFQMPDNEVTLIARFEYNPDNPGDPFGDGSQGNIQNKPTGDANGDGIVNVTDAVYLINVCLGHTTDADMKKCDVNGDGTVNVTDAVAIINICLKN